ncbi:unnamed protein product [Darwinula stevensoni]|uniref:Uncharacterized protein n=1 Tax=Darwinula stevensoni TaxID=69355 RepID=A0A7R9AGV6_9CRUS|nr:unnamed protein product [Darwinula stevensoni]CAG0904103.1 unnamed protein product [Darwinula stevensoni]
MTAYYSVWSLSRELPVALRHHEEVQSLRGDSNEVKSPELEKQVLELWDKIYEEYEGYVGMKEGYPRFQWGEISSTAQKIPISEVMNVTNMVQFVKNNVDMVKSILKNLWAMVVENVNLAFNTFSSVVNLVFGGGNAILNFFIDLVIFCSSLFYLLSSSGTLYKPVELVASFSLSSSSIKFGVAMRNAISGVFLVTFKVALFHGLWTWVMHELFHLRLIFIPSGKHLLNSLLAAVLAAVPFLETYWAAIPGVIELWAVNGRCSSAIFLVVFQLLPSYFVNDTLYGGIEG